MHILFDKFSMEYDKDKIFDVQTNYYFSANIKPF